MKLLFGGVIAVCMVVGCKSASKDMMGSLSIPTKILPLSAPPEQFILAGGSITASQVAGFEATLVATPGDLDARASLQGYYWTKRLGNEKARAAFEENALWIIRNAPDTSLAGSPLVEIMQPESESNFAEAEKVWDAHIARDGKNVKVLENAAKFFLLGKPLKSASYLKKAAALEPSNVELRDRLVHLYRLKMSTATGDFRVECAKNALEQLDEKAKIVGSRDLEYWASSTDLALEAGDLKRAESDAKEASKSAKDMAQSLPDEFHHAHLACGRVALRKGDLKRASEHLLQAAQVSGSPVLSSFGPNMLLAKELLQKGERAAVLKYFDACARFWSNSELQEWKRQVANGKTPDFGGNESY